MEHALCPFLHGLHGTAFPRSVENFQFRNDDLPYQSVRLRCQHLAVCILLEYLNARTMDQERVVQDEEVVVEDAQRVTLKQNWVNDSEKSRQKGLRSRIIA